MDPITLVTVSGLNPMAKKTKKNPGEKGKRSKRRNPTFGGRYKSAVKKSGGDLMTVAGMIGGNVAAQLLRSQVFGRIPVGNIAGHGIDVAADWLAVAPALEAAIPNAFGRGMALGVRFNSALAAVKTFTSRGTMASHVLSVSEYLPELPAPVEAPAQGAPMLPGYKYNQRTVGALRAPGNQGSNVGLRRAG